MGSGVESRFERYTEVLVDALGHADRATPARWYLRGLLLPGQRKSVEPYADYRNRQILAEHALQIVAESISGTPSAEIEKLSENFRKYYPDPTVLAISARYQGNR